jgi:hypothetical protein
MPAAGLKCLGLALAAGATLAAQQMPDRSFRPMLEDRAYAIGTGPVVCVDESHGNVHTLNDGFFPFGDLIRRDGYVVRTVATRWNSQLLGDCRIVVIVSPRSPVREAQELRRWVGGGGSLLVTADRDSLAATSELAAAFGVTFTDTPGTPATFRRSDQALRPHAIARGRHAKESVASVATFSGQLLRAPAAAEPLLVAADGALQGAVMRIESGRAAFFGDPAMFTAQIVGPERRVIGMSARGAEQNFQFVLNVMHWLSGVI